MLKIFNQPNWLRFIFLTALLSPIVILWGEIFTRMLLPQNVDSKMNIYASDPIVGFVFGNKGLMFNLTLEGSKFTKLVR